MEFSCSWVLVSIRCGQSTYAVATYATFARVSFTARGVSYLGERSQGLEIVHTPLQRPCYRNASLIQLVDNVQLFISLLVFYLLLLSIFERGALKSPTITWNWPISAVRHASVSGSYNRGSSCSACDIFLVNWLLSSLQSLCNPSVFSGSFLVLTLTATSAFIRLVCIACLLKDLKQIYLYRCISRKCSGDRIYLGD